MTVSELRTELERLPGDAIVVCAGAEVVRVDFGTGFCTSSGYWYGKGEEQGIESSKGPVNVLWLD